MNKISGKQIGIIVLTIATALIHLVLAFIFPPMMVLFILNAVGYLALLAGYFLPQFARFHNTIRWLLIAFSAATIVGYFAVNGLKMDPLGLLTKAIEVALIILLWMDGRQ